jgi:peptide/nickel transport system substrate-binding protein
MRVGVGVPPKGARGSGIANVVSAMTTEPWIGLAPDGRPTERVIRAWSVDEAGTTVRLKIRNDVRFHDGTLLTPQIAAEVMHATFSAPAPESASYAAVRSVKATGDDTVELQLSEPNSFLLTDLSLASVTLPEEKAEAGAFQVVTADDKQKKFDLKAFPSYYRGRPALDGIVVTQYPTQRNAWAALMRGDIDMLYDIRREAVDFVKAETTVQTYSFERPYANLLVFNVRHPVLKNVEVRRALSESLDKATLVAEGLRGRGRPADGPLVPEHWAYSPPAHPYVFNPAAAAARFEAAGLPVRAPKSGRMPSRFAFTCLVFADDTRFERLALLVQKQLANVGVDMTLQPVPQNQLMTRLPAGDFDAFLLEVAGRSLSWLDRFWNSRDNSFFDSGYTAADKAIERVRLARSEEQVRAEVADFLQIMHDDPPAVFLAWQETTRAVSRKFEVSAEPGRDIVPNAWSWRPAAR